VTHALSREIDDAATLRPRTVGGAIGAQVAAAATLLTRRLPGRAGQGFNLAIEAFIGRNSTYA
jgi:hypothetical protein